MLPSPLSEDISVRFLAEGEQTGEGVAQWLAAFIGEARYTLDFAVYDLRLSDPLRAIVVGALADRAAAGVRIRVAFDGDKPEAPSIERGMDPAPAGTESFVRALAYPYRRIGGLKLMHHKYVVRDAGQETGAVWTGSTNLTDDSWTLQENNIVTLLSPSLAGSYGRDFEQLWQAGEIGTSGGFDADPVDLVYQNQPAHVRVEFSPGCGPAIDYAVAHRVVSATRRIRICSMLLNSGALLAALSDVLRVGRVPVDGIYDRTQMETVLEQWREVRHNRWKIGAIDEIVDSAGLVGKHSTPYTPESTHDFMHNKVLVIDDTVITGSYNFSHSAELNAENILFIDSVPLADAYSAYIDGLLAKYGGTR